MPDASNAPRPRRIARYQVGLAALAAAALFVLWKASDALLLIFAAVLFAAFLDALSRMLGKVLQVGHGARLAIVCATMGLVLAATLAWGGTALAMQANEFIVTLREQFTQVVDWLEQRGINLPAIGAENAAETATSATGTQAAGITMPTFRSFLPNFESVFGTAWTAAAIIFGLLGNVFVIIVLGIFLAAQPSVYRDVVLLVVPPKDRPHVGSVLDEAGEMLRHWLLGQALTMTVIFLFCWIGLTLVGVQPAFVLGLQAGILAFVPTVGPLISGVFIVLASLGGGLYAVLGALGVYLGAQALESYLLTPMIQQRAIQVAPAFLFASQIVLSLLFGLYGLVLATPLAAIARVFILRFYVEDTLGDDIHETDGDDGL